MANKKYQVEMVEVENVPVEKEREIFSRVLDIFFKKAKPEKLASPKLSNNNDIYE